MEEKKYNFITTTLIPATENKSLVGWLLYVCFAYHYKAIFCGLGGKILGFEWICFTSIHGISTNHWFEQLIYAPLLWYALYRIIVIVFGPNDNEVLSNSVKRLKIIALFFLAMYIYGIGIHFTAYEWIDDYPIPELFLITNFDNTEYSALHADGIHVTRETFGVAFQIPNRVIEHSKPDYRHQVRKYLEAGKVLLYNNGDPFMFNAAFSSIRDLFRIAEQRRILKPTTDPKAHRDIVGWPIELVYKVQKYFVKEGHQMVGGKPHNLSVTPRAEYESDTGDAP